MLGGRSASHRVRSSVWYLAKMTLKSQALSKYASSALCLQRVCATAQASESFSTRFPTLCTHWFCVSQVGLCRRVIASCFRGCCIVEIYQNMKIHECYYCNEYQQKKKHHGIQFKYNLNISMLINLELISIIVPQRLTWFTLHSLNDFSF